MAFSLHQAEEKLKSSAENGLPSTLTLPISYKRTVGKVLS